MAIKNIFKKAKNSSGKTFKHSGNLGDIIFSLPTIIALGGGKLYLSNKTPGVETRKFTDDMLEQMIELLKTQSYLSDVCRYNGEDIDYNLDKFREIFACYDHIARWHLKAFNAQFDLTRAWLENIKPIRTRDIVINDTRREGDVALDWPILSKYEDMCVFAGFEHEYNGFIKSWSLNIPRHPTKTILEFAGVIKGAKLFIGNQSLGFALAEAMKVPRILKVHHHCPSCMPLSENARIILTEKILKHTFGIKKNFLSSVKLPRF